MGANDLLKVNGWTILLHPLFLDQVAAIAADVQRAKQKDPATYLKKNCTKSLAAILRLAFETIPQNPANPDYRQGDTLGSANTHWVRAKFFQQYRLFFRFDLKSKVIIYAWVNDENTKRAYGSRADAYAVFRTMLAGGDPPSDWAALKKACEIEAARREAAGEPSVQDHASAVRG